MGKFLFSALTLSLLIFLCATAGLAIEVTPRISDRDIVERLSRLEEGQKRLESRLDNLRSDLYKSWGKREKEYFDD